MFVSSFNMFHLKNNKANISISREFQKCFRMTVLEMFLNSSRKVTLMGSRYAF